MASWKTIEAIYRYCPTVIPVTDDGYRDQYGPIAGGTWDWHVAGCAVDFGGNSAEEMRDVAEWWYQFADHLIEEIHTTPFSTNNGFYVKNGERVSPGFYGHQTEMAHQNHVHIAMSEANANGLLRYLNDKYGEPKPPITPPPVTLLTAEQQAWNAAYNAGFNAAFKPGFNAGFQAGYRRG